MLSGGLKRSYIYWRDIEQKMKSRRKEGSGRVLVFKIAMRKEIKTLLFDPGKGTANATPTAQNGEIQFALTLTKKLKSIQLNKTFWTQ